MRGSVPVVGLEVGDAGRQAGDDALDGQRLEDHTSGERQHLCINDPKLLGDGGAGLFGDG